MGEAARRWLLRSTTETERLDIGLDMAEAHVAAVKARTDFSGCATEAAAARRLFWALRKSRE